MKNINDNVCTVYRDWSKLYRLGKKILYYEHKNENLVRRYKKVILRKPSILTGFIVSQTAKMFRKIERRI